MEAKMRMDPYDLFYRKTRDRIFSYLLRMTGDRDRASDFVQECYTRHYNRYRSGRRHVPLLYSIARNAVIDTFRKPAEEKVGERQVTGSSVNPEQALMDKEGVERIIAAVQSLAPGDRDIIYMKVMKNHTYKEMARLLDISESNVKIRIHRARIRLKSILEQGET